MASGVTSPLGIFAIVILIIGIMMAIIGIIFVISRQNQTKDWWIWTLLIGGLVMAIFGGILLAVAMASYETPPVVEACPRPMPGHHHVHQPGHGPTMCAPPAPMPMPVSYDHGHGHGHSNGYVYPQYSSYVPSAPMAPPPQLATAAPPAGSYTNVHTIGTPAFDPDPQMVTSRVQPSPQRVTATGPYGPNGETVTVRGTFTPAPLEIDHTYDIPNHRVQVTGAYPARVGYPAA